MFTNEGSHRIAALDLDTGTWKHLFPGMQARYVPSGHIVYYASGIYQVVAFDPSRIEHRGSAVPVLDGTRGIRPTGSAGRYFDVSDTGIVVSVPGGASFSRSVLTWLELDGGVETVPFDSAAIGSLRLDPIGTRVALSRIDGGIQNIWIYDLERGTEEKITRGSNNFHPQWTPDGRRIVFTTARRGAYDIFVKPTDALGTEEPLVARDDVDESTRALSPDGRWLAIAEFAIETGERHRAPRSPRRIRARSRRQNALRRELAVLLSGQRMARLPLLRLRAVGDLRATCRRCNGPREGLFKRRFDPAMVADKRRALLRRGRHNYGARLPCRRRRVSRRDPACSREITGRSLDRGQARSLSRRQAVLARRQNRRRSFPDGAAPKDELVRGIETTDGLELRTMPLEAGTKLGTYIIQAAIGTGGMGEIYRAKDTKLGREVAIKVLHEALRQDAERLARFEREARVLASLNHPGIATLHGLETERSITYLVMELVHGETLQERLARGPLTVEEAVGIFEQIAEALEAAHAAGVVHRDLKPANIKITPEGRVKILDFGLAKAFATEDDEAVSDLSSSPTLTRGATAVGVIMGTATYMSPEQARGKKADKRADIWAFGCVLFEAISGKKAFDGESVTDVLANVIHKDVPWEALPAETPWRVRSVLRRCLVKDAGQRFHDVADARIELLADERPPDSNMQTTAPKGRLLVLGLLFGLAVAVAVATFFLWRETPPGGEVQAFVVTPPASASPLLLESPMISPDGRRIVYIGVQGDDRRLYLRELGELGSRLLTGDRRRQLAVLLAGRSLGGVFRRRQDQENFGPWRSAHRHLRCLRRRAGRLLDG